MIAFFGNCQMQFVHDVHELSRVERSFTQLASPFTWLRAGRCGCGVPCDLAEVVRRNGLEDFLHDRGLENQFRVPRLRPGDLAVFNLFHENEPLFAHKSQEYVFFMDLRALEYAPEFKSWAESECVFFQGNPKTYLKRFYEMLKLFRAVNPRVAMLIVTRLTPRPAFGPAPMSYLRAWEEMHVQAADLLPEVAADLGRCGLLDLERVLAGRWRRGEKSFDAWCPFLRLGKEQGEILASGVRAARDVEHIAGIWSGVALHVLKYQRELAIRYAPEEAVPEEWDAPGWTVRELERPELVRLLGSGANYHFGRAIGHFLTHPSPDDPELLAAHGGNAPVCENSLHMMAHYARLRPGAGVREWSAAHRRTAEGFTAFGAEFRRRYLERLDEIDRLAAEDQTNDLLASGR